MIKTKTRSKIERDPNLLVPIAYDDIFKTIFGREENADITAYLISLLLKIPYEKVKGKIIFKSTNHNKNRTNEKNSLKDIVFVVDTSEAMKINLEMNYRDYLEQLIIDRNVYFQSNLFGSGLKIKDEYRNIKTTIQYNFNLDYVDKLQEPLIDEYVYRNERGNVLTEKSKIVHINIQEMSKLWYNGEYKKFKEISPILFGISALMLEDNKKAFEKLVLDIKMEKEIKEQLERIVMDLNIDDELVIKYYDLDEERRKMNEAILEAKRKEFKEEAKKLGIKGLLEQGILENQKDIVLNMYKDNCKVDVISKYTNLSVEEVENIINNSK